MTAEEIAGGSPAHRRAQPRRLFDFGEEMNHLQMGAQLRALADVLDERSRQDAIWGGPEHDDRHELVDFLTFIADEQVVKATQELSVNDQAAFRSRLVKISALALAGVESFDRRFGT